MAPVIGDYGFSLAKGCDVRCLLFETFGGLSADVTRLLGRAAWEVGNKLSNEQYLDEATWATRSWLAMQQQRLSIALHTACAWEIVQELRESATGAA